MSRSYSDNINDTYRVARMFECSIVIASGLERVDLIMIT